MSKKDIFDVVLVVDTKREILKFLHPTDLLKLRLINTQFFNCVDDDFFWNKFVEEYFGGFPKTKSTSSLKTFLDFSKGTFCLNLSLIDQIPKDLLHKKTLYKKVRLNLNGRIGIPYKTHLLPVSFLEENSPSYKNGRKDLKITSSLIFQHKLKRKITAKELKAIKVGYYFFATMKFDKGSTFLGFLGRAFLMDGNKEDDFILFDMYEIRDRLLEWTRKKKIKGAENMTEEELSDYLPDFFEENPMTEKLQKWIDWVWNSKKIDEIITKYLCEDYCGIKLKMIEDEDDEDDDKNDFESLKREKTFKVHSIYFDHQEEKNLLTCYLNFKNFNDPIEHLIKRKIGENTWGKIDETYGYGMIFFPMAKILKNLKLMMNNPEKFRKKKKKKKKKNNFNKQIKMKWKTFISEITFESLESCGFSHQFGGDESMCCSGMFLTMRYALQGVASITLRNSKYSQVNFSFEPVQFPLFDHVFAYGKSSSYSSASACVEALKKERDEAERLEKEIEDELAKELNLKAKEKESKI